MLKRLATLLRASSLVAVFLLALTGCGSGVSDETDIDKNDVSASEESEDVEEVSDDGDVEEDSEVHPKRDATFKELAEKLVLEYNLNPDDIRRHLYTDFDNDGVHECFFFIGEPVNMEYESGYGNVFFVNSENITQLCDTRYIGVLEDGEMFWTMKYGNLEFVVYDEVYATDRVSYVYSIKNSDLVVSVISGLGDVQPKKGTDYVSIIHSEYDAIYTREPGLTGEEVWFGHTWKEYYFYYDEESEDFREYGGSNITENELDKICGFELSDEIKGEDYEIGDIFRRANGIVNVNYFRKERDEFGNTRIQYMNANYDRNTGEFLSAWGADEKTWQNSNFGGKYDAALLPDIADYD